MHKIYSYAHIARIRPEFADEKSRRMRVPCVQALLKRHESSMAEAESRQAETAVIMSDLETKTTELEDENSKKTEENKRLLHSLEELNASMAMSELRVKELQEDLDAAHVSA
jgi:chromosome segregation ATPase